MTSRENALQFDPEKGEGQLTVEMQRTNDKFKDTPLVLVPLGLPSGVTSEIKRSAPGTQETYDLVLKGLKNLPAGEHAFRYFAYAELAGQGRGVLSGDIRLVPGSSDKPADPAPKEDKENKAASQ